MPFDLGDRLLTVDASIGVAWAASASNADQMMQQADRAMYRAKRRGGTALAVGGRRGSDESGPDRLTLDAELRQAIDRGELFLVYQPILDLRSGRVTGVEALVRWGHPVLGLLAPDEFLPAADQAGLGPALTRFVMTTALAELASWDVVLGAGAVPRVAINVSPRHMVDADLDLGVLGPLASSTIAPDRVVIEVVESALVTDLEIAGTALQRLQSAGLGVAVDDFGAGATSLAHLTRLPATTLKLDRAFVAALTTSRADASVVGAMLELGRALGLTVVAEGIETEEQLGVLRALGCDEGQGYHLAGPMTAGAATRWLAANQDRVAIAS